VSNDVVLMLAWVIDSTALIAQDVSFTLMVVLWTGVATLD
jgi:hypothetical protein